MSTFIDSTHVKLLCPSKKSPPAAMHLYRSNEVLLCECVNDQKSQGEGIDYREAEELS